MTRGGRFGPIKLFFDFLIAPVGEKTVSASDKVTFLNEIRERPAFQFETETFRLSEGGERATETVTVSRDVTTRIRERTEIKNSQMFLDSIIENIPDMVFLKEPDELRFICFNRAGEELLGIKREELRGKNDYDFFPTEQADFFCRKDREVLHDRKLVDIPCESIQTSSGDARYLHTKKIPVLDAQGAPLYLLGISEDITKRLNAEQWLLEAHHELEWRVVERTAELEQAHNELQSIYDTSPAGLAFFDRRLCYTKINSSLAQLSGRSVEDHIGRHFREVMPAQLADDLELVFLRVLGGEGVDELEIRVELPCQEGREAYFLFTCAPLWATSGEIFGVNAVVIDVTDRKRAEEALRTADRRKDEFLAMLAHELRNPLAPLRNAEHILRLGTLSDPNPCLARDIIGRQVGHMARLVDDLLEVSRITRGKITLQPRVIRLDQIISSVVEVVEPLIEAKRQELTVRLPEHFVYLTADSTRVAQILGNLLNNAMKYTDAGGHIWLSGEVQGSEVVLKVKDDGIGIVLDLLPTIFDPLTQLDRSLDRAQGGLGIGLALVKNLVELHGGTVEARSEGPDRGSEFEIRLQSCESPEETGTASPSDPTDT